jgi:hypothetical protein
MTLQNKDGFTFLYLFYQRNRDYLFKDESSSISQKFKMLFTLIYEKDSYTFNILFPTKIINEIIKFIYGINFIHRSLTKVSPEQIIEQLNVLDNKAPFLLYSSIYLKNAKINLLNDIKKIRKME